MVMGTVEYHDCGGDYQSLHVQYNSIGTHTYTHTNVCMCNMLARRQETGSLIHCRWEYKILQPFRKKAQQFLSKLKMDLPYNPTIYCWTFIPMSYFHIRTCA